MALYELSPRNPYLDTMRLKGYIGGQGRGFLMRLWVITGVVLLATACGKGGTGGTCEVSTPTLEEAQKQAKTTEVSCFTDEDCNPSVGMIAVAQAVPKPGLSVCTGFLVAPDILATNSHCV